MTAAYEDAAEPTAACVLQLLPFAVRYFSPKPLTRLCQSELH